MKRICIMALLPLLILTGCTTISSREQEDISELRDPITLTFLAIDSESPEKIDSETEVILCAENPSPFTLEADTQGSYNTCKKGQQVGWIFLIQDNEGLILKSVKLSEIMLLWVKLQTSLIKLAKNVCVIRFFILMIRILANPAR